MVLVLGIIAPEDLSGIFNIPLEELDCAGLKLTLSNVYRIGSSGMIKINGKKLPKYIEVSPVNNIFHLKQGAYLVKYSEYIRVPSDAIALAIQRSSLLRMGASLYTAVWDPGYEGRGSGLLAVHNEHGICIEKGAQIAQLVFIRMNKPTKKLYRGSYFREK